MDLDVGDVGSCGSVEFGGDSGAADFSTLGSGERCACCAKQSRAKSERTSETAVRMKAE